MNNEPNEDAGLDSYYESLTELPEYHGPGSGEDDLADYNANEADDYRNEGEDSFLDSHYESQYELGE